MRRTLPPDLPNTARVWSRYQLALGIMPTTGASLRWPKPVRLITAR